jgi:AGZA family xanthine/uracil permease-like MFS transporter
VAYPLTYSISNGIGAGFILFTLIKLLTGKGKEVHWLMYIVSFAFAVDFMIPVLKMVFGF